MTPAREIRLARLLLLLSVVLGICLTLAALLAATAAAFGRLPMPGALTQGALLFAVLSAAGSTAGILAVRHLESGRIRKASRCALVAVVLPPPNLVALLAGGLLHTMSRERAAMATATDRASHG